MKEWLKKNSSKLGLGVFILAILAYVFLANSSNNPSPEEESFGANFPDAQWVVVDGFTGYKTKIDPQKIDDGANPQGQNTTINEGDRISIRNLGYDLLPSDGTLATSSARITSMHTFRKRDGSNIQMRAWGTVLEYFETGNTTWETLKSGLTSGQDFGFADYNINTDLQSYVYFGNASNDFSRWTGNHTMTNGALSGGEDRIVVDSVTGFPETGTLIYCGTEQAYTFRQTTSSPTFILDGTATACADNRGVAEAVNTNATNPKGNIYIVANNRLFISGVASSTQAVFFSAYGDAVDFSSEALVTDSTAESPGIFNLGEGGGGVTGMAMDENAIYIFKRSIIYKATLTDSLYTLETLKPFDGRSQSVGAINNRSIFSSGNNIYFVSEDNQIMSLQRVAELDYPQIIPISDDIKPTVDAMNFASSTAVVFQDKAYISTKKTSDSSINDVVLTWNIRNRTWDTPIIGWNVSDWTIYDDESDVKLYFGDSASANTFEVTDDPLDYIFGVTANWRTKQFDFGAPHLTKEISDFYIEGYIAQNTDLTISLLLDDDGFSQAYKTTISGTESDYIFDAEAYNLFGLSPFGTQRFGSNEDISGKKKFRVYLNKSFRIVPFYNAQIEFASDGESQEWEITNFAMKVRVSPQPQRSSLFRAFQ